MKIAGEEFSDNRFGYHYDISYVKKVSNKIKLEILRLIKANL